MSKRVGILGTGQLAMMLTEAGHKLGLDVVSFADPAQLTPVDVVTFENEFIDTDALRSSPLKFVPGLDAIALLQDKLQQKRLFDSIRIPTARCDDAPRTNDRTPRVLKWSRQGYDGHGVFFVKSDSSLEAMKDFFEQARAKGAAVYAEEKIDFKRELAIQIAHSTTGEKVLYPLVISEQQNGVCKKVIGPATAFGVSPELEQQAIKIATRISHALPVYGVLAVEMFETQDGKLLVNELAPRVHNSGHYSREAAQASQFENHMRAVAGMSLAQPQPAPFFAMLNLLGPPGLQKTVKNLTLPPPPKGVSALWYQKSEIRPGRKLGHLTARAQTAEELESLLQQMENYEKTLWSQIS